MLWLEALEDFPRRAWNGEAVVWVCPGGAGNDTDSSNREWRRQRRGKLLRRLASRVLGIPADHLCMERQANGRPRVKAPELLWCSSASRGEWDAIAVARKSVGVDIEARPLDMPIPLPLLHPAERMNLQACESDMRENRFLQFWTAREAYLKSLGRGLDAALACSRAEQGPDGTVTIIANGIKAGAAQIRIAQGYVAAAIEGSE